MAEELPGTEEGAAADPEVAPASLAEPEGTTEGAPGEETVAPEGEPQQKVAEEEPVETQKRSLTDDPDFQAWQQGQDKQTSTLRQELADANARLETAEDRMAVQGMEQSDAELYLAKRNNERLEARVQVVEQEISVRDELGNWQTYIAKVATDAGAEIDAAQLNPTAGVDGMIEQAIKLAVAGATGKVPKTEPTRKAPAASPAKSPGEAGQSEIETLKADPEALRTKIREKLDKGESLAEIYAALGETT